MKPATIQTNKLKKRELIIKTIVLTLGVFILFSFFLNSYIRFDSFKKYALDGKIQEIKKARVGYVFKFEFSSDFYSLYIKSENEKELRVGDSISKEPFADKINVYRNLKNKTEFYKSYKIENGLFGQ